MARRYVIKWFLVDWLTIMLINGVSSICRVISRFVEVHFITLLTRGCRKSQNVGRKRSALLSPGKLIPAFFDNL
jgi:hypothetical protein